jgi:hypothetical protein
MTHFDCERPGKASRNRMRHTTRESMLRRIPESCVAVTGDTEAAYLAVAPRHMVMATPRAHRLLLANACGCRAGWSHGEGPEVRVRTVTAEAEARA